MSLNHYGVLIGRPVDRRLGAGAKPHYQVHLVDDQEDYRIAINVRSQQSPPDLEYVIIDPFQHPLTEPLGALPLGFHPLPSQPGGLALDYIRGNVLKREDMRTLPFSVSGPDNDLNERIDSLVQRALGDEDALVYAFGERWGPEPQKDKIFGFKPGNGIHDIHMNQGNSGRFSGDNGVWQDGGLLFRYPGRGSAPAQWVAIFLKFQSQTWHTRDTDGFPEGATNPVSPAVPAPPGGGEGEADPQGVVMIVAALINSIASPEVESVTLINTSPQPQDLAGWAIKDKNKRAQPVTGVLAPGATLVVTVDKTARPPVELSNQGGIITLVDASGIKVDGVSYTKQQASNPGWTVVFR